MNILTFFTIFGLLLFLLLVLAFLVLAVINIYEQIVYWNDPKKMLFLPSYNRHILEKLDLIISKYDLQTKTMNLVELGCGRAGILRYLVKKYSWQSNLGIEGQFVVWLQAKLLSLGQKVNLKYADFYKSKWSKPSFQYCYLGKKLMLDLYKQGKFDDTFLVSLDYPIDGLECTEKLELQSKTKIQNCMYIYDLRKKNDNHKS
jgi:hypothetical protein